MLEGQITIATLSLPAALGKLWQTPGLLYSQVFAESFAVMCGITGLCRVVVHIRNNLSLWAWPCPSTYGLPSGEKAGHSILDSVRVPRVYLCWCLSLEWDEEEEDEQEQEEQEEEVHEQGRSCTHVLWTKVSCFHLSNNSKRPLLFATLSHSTRQSCAFILSHIAEDLAWSLLTDR